MNASESRAPLAGRTAIVTGASRGLGREIARAMWRAGASLLLVSRPSDALRRVHEELLDSARPGQTATPAAIDLLKPGAAVDVLEAALQAWPGIDILVNNAGVLGPIGPLWENDLASWNETLQLDLVRPVELCHAAIPSMRSRGGGKIVNLSGGGATAPRPRFSAYASAKAGLVRFSEVLAQEVRPLNIQVNCVAPGPMNTRLAQAVLDAGPERAGAVEYQRAVEQQSSEAAVLARAADLCVFLASGASDRITGRLISAVWDPWPRLDRHADDLAETDIYTLRRIVPADRGKDWA